MKYNGYYNCKFCGKTWWHKSNWIPFELVDWIYSLLFSLPFNLPSLRGIDFQKCRKGIVANSAPVLVHDSVSSSRCGEDSILSFQIVS